MSTLAWVLLGLAAWTAVSVAFGLLVGGVIRLRDERERPTRITAIEPEVMRELGMRISQSLTGGSKVQRIAPARMDKSALDRLAEQIGESVKRNRVNGGDR